MVVDLVVDGVALVDVVVMALVVRLEFEYLEGIVQVENFLETWEEFAVD